MRLTLLVLLLILSFNSFAIERTGIREIRKVLRDNNIKPDDTCLDEYLLKRRKIIKRMSFGLAGGGVAIGTTSAVAGSSAATVATTNAAGTVVNSVLWPFAPIVAGSTITVAGAATGVALIGYESVQAIRLAKNGKLIKAIFQARVGEGKQLDRLYKRFKKKHGKNFIGLNKQIFAQAVLSTDQAGRFCPKKVLTRPKVLDAINDTLAQQDDPNKCGDRTVLSTGSSSAISHRTSKEKNGWAYLFNVTKSQIEDKVHKDNMRPVDIEKSYMAGRYHATFVKNAGENKVSGHWWIEGSIKNITKKAKALNARVIDLDLIKKSAFGKRDIFCSSN